ncbi:g protein-coupled receptor-related [Anaeramoeba ignava]|uniref:G protein-coupled receptor-related n=1 Tax=Anaeramoeba ignava TaxID=1746090 RepID=A0A9Q0LRV8_ANAIG|nr:g protein-coupled receptor-related [Anaeramoeba ignava]
MKNSKIFIITITILLIFTKKVESITTLYVDCTTTNTGACGDFTTPCGDITSALNLIPENGTILITSATCSGTGNTNITTSKSVEIACDAETCEIGCANMDYGIVANYTGSTGTLQLNKIKFQNCLISTGSTTSAKGAAVHVVNGNLNVSNCVFWRNQVSGTATADSSVLFSGSIFVENPNFVMIQNSQFAENTNDVSGASSIGIVSNVSGTTSPQIQIVSSSFTQNSGQIGSVFVEAVGSSSDFFLDILDNSFANNNGAQSGVLLIDNDLLQRVFQANITGNVFQNNYGNKTGAAEISTSNLSTLKANLTQNIFANNTGNAKSGAVTMQINLAQDMQYQIINNTFDSNLGHKGTIGFFVGYLSNFAESISAMQNTDIVFESNSFTHNFADFGGAIYIETDSDLSLSKNTFANNSAINAGCVYISSNTTVVESESVYENNTAEQSVAMFAFTDSLVTIRNNMYKAQIQDETFVEILSPKTPNWVSNNSVKCPSNSVVTINEEVNFEQALEHSFGCDVCLPGTYSFPLASSSITAGTCFDCPAEAICRGGMDIRAKSGFWGTQLDPAKKDITFFFCPTDYCSNEDSEFAQYSHCSGNRDGTLCGDCKPGYTETLRMHPHCASTEKCHTQIAQFLLLLLPKVIIYAILLLYIPQLKSASFHIFPFIDILISFSQLVSLQTNLEIFSDFAACPSASPINSAQKMAMQLVGPFTFFLAVFAVYFSILIFTKIRRAKAAEKLSDSHSQSDSDNDPKKPKSNDDKDSDIDSGIDKPKEPIAPKIKTKSIVAQINRLEAQLVSDTNPAEWQRAEKIADIRDNDVPSDDTSSLSTLPNDQDLSDLDPPDIANLIRIFPEIEKLVNEDVRREKIIQIAEEEAKLFPSQSLTKRLGISLLTILFLSYFPILNAFANLTSCIKIPYENEPQRRIFLFASVSCYQGWQIFVIILILILVLLPFLLFWILRRKTISKNFLNWRNSFYFPFRERYYWFSCVMLLWRVVLIFANSYANNNSLRVFLITSFSLLILIAHLQTNPFLLKIHNRLQTVSLFILTLFSAVNLIHSTWSYGGIAPGKQAMDIVGDVFRYFLFVASFLLCCYAIFLFFRMIFKSILFSKCK